MTYNITVENIKCGGCMHTIETTLQKMKGISTVVVDKDKETITINASDDLQREKIVHKLASLGYPEKGNNNLLLKAKSFVSCAVGKMSS